MSTRIHEYVTVVCTAAVAAAVAVFLRDTELSHEYAQAAITFGLISLMAQVLSYRSSRSSSGSLSFIPILASMSIAPHWISVVTVGGSSLAAQILARRTPIKAVFNTAHAILSASLAIFAYLAVGGRPLHNIGESASLPLFALFLVFSLTNSVCVSGAIGIASGRVSWAVWKEIALSALPYDFLCLPVILFFVWIYTQYGVVGAFVLAVPLLGLRQLYKINYELEQTNRELLELMVAAIEARDPYTSGHSRRVAEKARMIARAVGLREKEIERIVAAALLHDVGKIHEVFGPILSKPGRLTPEEQVIMRTHPIKSAELAGTVTQLRDVVPLIRHHHENWDGTGYPDGLRGDSIPLGSRIIMFADTIDAMTTDRPYRAALDATAVRKELLRFRGTQFDPQICDALLRSSEYSKLFANIESAAKEWVEKTPERGTVLRAAVS
jgi:putative nucleotidyltransferase with HDIG domain